MVNFVRGELFMIVTYVMYVVAAVPGLPFPIDIVFAAVLLFAVGRLIDRGLVAPLRRRAGRDGLVDSSVLTTGLVFSNLAHIAFGSRRGGITTLFEGSIQLGGSTLNRERLSIFLVALLAVLCLFAFIRATAPRQSHLCHPPKRCGAQTLGIDVGRMCTIAFGIEGALAGIAGAMLISLFPAFPSVG